MGRMCTPVTSAQICGHYGISASDFAAYPKNIRALYRFAYEADVLKLSEDPKGSNRGPDVDRFNLLAGAALGSPWCASALTANLVDSGVDRGDLPDNAASVHAWLDWAKEQERVLDQPVRGCAFVMIFSPTEGHMGMIASVENGSIDDLSGNTNSDGSREGYEIARHTRDLKAYTAFIDLEGL